LERSKNAGFILQDEIVPFFDAIMTPLKQFLVYDENPDSFVMFNQTLDTLAYLARAAGPSGNFKSNVFLKKKETKSKFRF
jgi:hypothetical protein